LKNIAAEEIGSTIFGDLDSLDAAKAPLDLGSLTELFTAAPDKVRLERYFTIMSILMALT